jgi:hypothetical protein
VSDGAFLREAEKQEIIMTRPGEPAGVLIGSESGERSRGATAGQRLPLHRVRAIIDMGTHILYNGDPYEDDS